MISLLLWFNTDDYDNYDSDDADDADDNYDYVDNGVWTEAVLYDVRTSERL